MAETIFRLPSLGPHVQEAGRNAWSAPVSESVVLCHLLRSVAAVNREQLLSARYWVFAGSLKRLTGWCMLLDVPRERCPHRTLPVVTCGGREGG